MAAAMGTVVATEFLGPDVLLTIEPTGDADLLTVRQHSFGCPELHAKVNIDIVGRPVILKSSGA
jgi:iron(III) transport system ATP-binding protein